MYAREFVAGVLAGLDNALEVLLEGTDQEVRAELADLTMQIRSARARIDPKWGAEECSQSEIERG